MRWSVYEYGPLTVHVLPEGDTKPHTVEVPCWCDPQVEMILDRVALYLHTPMAVDKPQ